MENKKTETQAKPPKSSANAKAKGKGDYENPGLRQTRSTSLFRVVNFELYTKPNKTVMTFGISILAGVVGYMIYMNIFDNQRKEKYAALNPDGSLSTRERVSKWD